MKTIPCIIVTLMAFLAVGCDKQKTAINEDRQAAQEEIDARKADVNTAAKEVTDRATTDATIDKARIEAIRESDQAQLDANKKKVDAEAEAAKAKVDAQNK